MTTSTTSATSAHSPAARPAGRIRRAVLGAALSAALGAGVLAGGPATPAAAETTVAVPGGCALPADSTLETTLAQVKPHPRIVLTKDDTAVIRQIAADPARATAHRRIMRNAEAWLTWALPSYGSGSTASGRLMSVGRTATDHILAFGYAYAATGEARYADRIRQEVAAMAAFPDWAPDHLLSTTEIATAVATGYSLTAAVMPAAEKSAALGALVAKSIKPASCLWVTGDWRVTATHNWGTVANAGQILAALAVADSNRPLAAAVLRQALTGANGSLATVARDGGSAEGPGYTGYVNYFAAYILSSMRGALGDTGANLVTSVPNASRYAVAIKGPTGATFNYADSDTRTVTPLLSAWNGKFRADALGAWLARSTVDAGHSHPMLTVWDAGTGTAPSTALPPAVTFPATGVATLRNGYGSDATWVAIKGGNNTANHSHLDLGSFVLDMGGSRFVGDHGKDNYSLPYYFTEPQRFSYFRTGTAGQSTLAVPGRNQSARAWGGVSTPVRKSGGAYQVTVDTTRALGLSKGTRTVSLEPNGSVILADRVYAAAATSLRWVVHTEAAITVAADGRSAVLTRDGRSVRVSLGSDTRGVLRKAAAPTAPTGSIPTTGWSMLMLDTATRTVSTSPGHYAPITVTFARI